MTRKKNQQYLRITSGSLSCFFLVSLNQYSCCNRGDSAFDRLGKGKGEETNSIADGQHVLLADDFVQTLVTHDDRVEDVVHVTAKQIGSLGSFVVHA